MIQIHDAVTPYPDIVFTEVGSKEAVLLHLGTKMYFSLNETGVFIWKLLSNGQNLGEISKKLQDAYDITSEKADDSVLTIINELVKENLIEVVRE